METGIFTTLVEQAPGVAAIAIVVFLFLRHLNATMERFDTRIAETRNQMITMQERFLDIIQENTRIIAKIETYLNKANGDG